MVVLLTKHNGFIEWIVYYAVNSSLRVKGEWIGQRMSWAGADLSYFLSDMHNG